MYDFSIGVMLESFKLPIPEAIKKAKELGVPIITEEQAMEQFGLS